MIFSILKFDIERRLLLVVFLFILKLYIPVNLTIIRFFFPFPGLLDWRGNWSQLTLTPMITFQLSEIFKVKVTASVLQHKYFYSFICLNFVFSSGPWKSRSVHCLSIFKGTTFISIFYLLGGKWVYSITEK